LLAVVAWCCQNFLPNLSAALLAAAPLRALFLALAFALAFANSICRWRFFVAGCWLLLLGAALLVRCFAGRCALASALALAYALALALANNLCRWRFFRCWLLGAAAWCCLTCPLLCWPLRPRFRSRPRSCISRLLLSLL
jgi:hypothetical protein